MRKNIFNFVFAFVVLLNPAFASDSNEDIEPSWGPYKCEPGRVQ